MDKINIFDIEGMEFPAGRRTRVILGQNGAIRGEKFCQGFVVIYPGGGIPEHNHETVESYTILKGSGVIEIDGEPERVQEGDFVFISSGKSHSLSNTGEEDMHMMFVYAPDIIVDHWAQEQINQNR